MKTKASPTARPAATREASPKAAPGATAAATTDTNSAFYALLDRQVQQPHSNPAAKAEGIAIGTLVHVGPDGGSIQVDIPSLGLQQLPAASMVRLAPANIGQSLALGFEGANAHKPIVLGLMMVAPADATAASAGGNARPPADNTGAEQPNAVRVSQNGRRVVVEAEAELELRCGDAVILLSGDGSVQIRGAYVTTHASASNRIRGGSVQIN